MSSRGPLANREQWLTDLASQLEPIIRRTTRLQIRPYRIACGWPSRRGTSVKNRLVGECWTGMHNGVAETFISPAIDDSLVVAETVGHELLHACLAPGVGHRKPFSQAAKRLGLIGRPSATRAGAELTVVLQGIVTGLGPYPHDRIAVDHLPEKCRNLKFMCPKCGYIGRTSAKWLQQVGPPICFQCHLQMTAEEDLDPEQPLELTDQVTEFRIPGDLRFSIRVSRSQRSEHWHVIDFAPEESTPTHTVASRHTHVESRQNALDLIEGLRTGLTTYEMLENLDDQIDLDPGDYLDDDEDEPCDFDDPGDGLGDVEQRRRAALALLRGA